MEKVNIYGRTVHHIRVHFMKVAGMEKEIGGLREMEVMYIVEDTNQIKRVVMVDIYGRMDAFTKETSKTI